MFGKKKDIKQEQPTIPKKTEEPKLTDDNKSGFKKVNESRQLSKMANLPSDTNVKGTIKFSEAMKIDGNFEGTLITDNGDLIVGKTGTVKANVKVRSAVIEGRVYGEIIVSDKVELKQNSHIIGDLQTKILVIEEGAVLVGKCNVNPEGVKLESQKEEIKINKT
ncbi:MAG: bactofilin family protein [Planctomycetota bacterium]|jgi:cytoskeletal protein CcmA (bactofilin family)